jgi:hypothetical protein
MAADRSGDAMKETAVDRELRAMLAVDPSPALVAGVRARIAAEPQPQAWWLSWRIALALAAAAVVTLVVFVARPRERPASPTSASSAPAQQRPTVGPTAPGVSADQPLVRVEPQPPSPQDPAQAGAAPRRAANRGMEPALPPTAASPADVLVDARESAALRALIFGVRAGTLDLQPVLRASTPSAMELPPVAEIAIDPITIDPLEQGERQ